MKLTLFIDTRCPLCVAETRQLKALDHSGNLQFVDIHANDFPGRWPQLDPEAVYGLLHGQRADGTWLYGLDVTAEAWGLVGRHRWLKLLRLPVIRWFADLCYHGFARYRSGFSYLLTGQRHCQPCSEKDGSCGLEPDSLPEQAGEKRR